MQSDTRDNLEKTTKISARVDFSCAARTMAITITNKTSTNTQQQRDTRDDDIRRQQKKAAGACVVPLHGTGNRVRNDLLTK